jgi:hypothetical protein
VLYIGLEQRMDSVGAKRIITILVLAVFVFGVARGINFPNIWTYTHYLFPCSEFFAKRTAFGCMVELVGIQGLYTYEAFVYYCFLVLFVFLLSLAWLMVTTIARDGFFVFPGIFVFCAGLAPVYLSNIPGYFDFLGALVLLLGISIKSFRLKFLVVFFGYLCLVFVHEAIVIIFIPLAIVDLLMTIYAADQKLQRKRVLLVLIMGFSILILALAVANSSISPEMAMYLLAGAQEKTSIPLDRGVFDVFSRDIDDNRRLFLWWWGLVTLESGWLAGIKGYIGGFLLGALIISALNFKMASHVYGSKLLAVTISLAPLSALALLFVAYDIIRWAAWATACSFCLYVILCARGGAVALRSQRVSFVLIILFALYQTTISIPLLVPREAKPVIPAAVSYLHSVLTGAEPLSPNKPVY